MIEYVCMGFATFFAMAVVEGVRREWIKLSERTDAANEWLMQLDQRVQDLEASDSARKELPK